MIFLIDGKSNSDDFCICSHQEGDRERRVQSKKKQHYSTEHLQRWNAALDEELLGHDPVDGLRYSF